MSITETYGDTLINGLLAGARFRGLQEDLKLARLQAAEFESGRAFRKQQEELALQLGQAQVSTAKTAQEIQQHQLKQYERFEEQAIEDRPLELATKKANLAGAKATAKGQKLQNKKAKQDLAFAAREQGPREALLAAQIGSAEAATASSQASTEYTGALRRKTDIESAKELGRSLQPREVPAAFGTMTHGLAPARLDPDVTDIIAALQEKGVDPKAMPALVNVALGSMRDAIEERDSIRQRLALEKDKETREAQRDKNAQLGESVRLGLIGGELVNRNPAALAAIESVFPNDPVVQALSRAAVSKQLRPEAQVKMKGLSKAYEDSLARVTQAELDLESGDFTGDNWVSRFFLAGDSEEKKRAKAEKALKAEKKSLQVLENRINQLYASGQESESSAVSGVTQADMDQAARELPNGSANAVIERARQIAKQRSK